MPNNIDERVVEMRIDNKQFVKGAEKTITVLDKLKTALNFKEHTADLRDFQNAVQRVDFSGLTDAIETISDKFTVLGIIGKRALENLADSIYAFSTRAIKSLSIEQIYSGYSKYEQKMKSVQTMMANTASKLGTDYADQAEQLEDINAQMDRLVFFTDETSYSFSAMSQNMAQFISAGIGIESARIDMQGVAAAAGLAGISVEQATRAMNNLSQAMAMGTLRLEDWKSLEIAGIVTDEFKKVIAETAVECEKLEKTADGMYKTIAKGNKKSITFSAEGIRGVLSEGFVDREVMEKVLHKYGEFSDVLNTISDDTGITATDLLQYLDEYEKGELDLYEVQKEVADYIDDNEVPSIQALSKAFETLSDDQLDLGKRAFKASQEYNSFTDAINATKDAVSTGWMTTFEYIFGNYMEAKKVWTAIGDELYDIFAAGAERRNTILGIWHDEGGRDAFLESFRNIFDSLISIFDAIRSSFQNVFRLGKTPREAANKLIELTQRFEAFTESLEKSEDTINSIKNVFEIFFNIISKIGIKVFNGLINAGKEIKRIFEPIKKAFSSVFSVDTLTEFSDKVSDILDKFTEFLSSLRLSDEALDGLEYILGKIFSLIDNGLNDIEQGPLGMITKFIEDTIKSIRDLINNVLESQETLDKIYSIFSSIFNFVINVVGKIGSAFVTIGTEIKRLFAPIKDAFKSIFDADTLVTITDVMQVLVDRLATFLSKLKLSDKALQGLKYILETVFGIIRDGIINVNDGFFSKIFSFIGRLIMFVRNLANAFLEAFAGGFSWDSLWSGLSEAFHGLGDTIGTIWDFVSSIFQGIISFIDKIKTGLDSLGGIIGIITKVFEWLSNLIASVKESLKEAFSEDSLGSDIIKIAAGIALIIKAILSGRNVKWAIENFISPIKGMLNSISEAFDAIGEMFSAKKWETYGKTFKDFGLSLLMLAAALWILSSIDLQKIGGSLFALVGIIGGLLEVMWVLNRFDGKAVAGKIALMAFALVELAAAILIISLAVALLSFADIEKVGSSVIALSLMLTIIIVLIKQIENEGMGKLALLGLALIEIAAAIAILAMALTLLSLAKVEKVWSSVAALAVLFAIILVLSEQIEKKGMGQFALFGLALMEIAAALAVLAVALTLLSLAKVDKVWSAVGALTVLLALILVFTSQVEEVGNIALLGVALIAIAAAIAILAAAIVLLSFVDYGKMFAAVGAMVLLLASIVIIAMLAQGFILGALAILAISAAIIILAGAFLVIAVALRLMNGLDLAYMADGLSLLGLSLVILAVGLAAMTVGLVGAVALVIAAGGLILLGMALNLMEGLDLIGMSDGISLLSLALIILSVAGVALIAGVIGLIAGAAAITLMGLALIPLASGLKKLEDVSWGDILKYLALLAASGAALALLAPILGPVAIAVAAFGVACLAAGAGIALAGEGMEKIANSLKSIPESAKSSLVAIADSMRVAVGDVRTNGEEIMTVFKEAADNIIRAIEDHGHNMVRAFVDIGNNCLNVISDTITNFTVLGGNIDAGIANGIYERADDPVQAMKWLAYAMQNEFAGDFQINSPSRVMTNLASFIPLGAEKGLETTGAIAEEAMASLGSRMLSAIYPSLEILSTILNEEYDFSPTITPVVDMSSVNASTAEMNRMMASANISTSMNANAIDSMVANAGRITEEMNNAMAGQVANGDSFVINVYSQPGMDENELANAVMYKIQNGIIRKGATLG